MSAKAKSLLIALVIVVVAVGGVTLARSGEIMHRRPPPQRRRYPRCEQARSGPSLRARRVSTNRRLPPSHSFAPISTSPDSWRARPHNVRMALRMW